MALDPSTVRTMSPAELKAAVKAASDDELAADLTGPQREELLDALFDRFPGNFLPNKASGRSARLNFSIPGGSDEDGADTYAVVVSDGTCTVEKDPTEDPNVTLTMGPVEFIKTLTGTGNATMMFMTGKIKMQGNMGLATALGSWFTPDGA